MNRGPHSLFRQIFLAAALIAVVTALFSGLLTARLVRADAQSRARQTLSKLADAGAIEINQSVNADRGGRRTLRTLDALRVEAVQISPAGAVTPASAPLRGAVSASDERRLLAGHDVSSTRPLKGTDVLVEGRPTANGALVLLQRQQDAIGATTAVIWRVAIALLVALTVAALLALVLSRRLARPLRLTAQAAHAIADGDRDVRVDATGSTEARELATAINSMAASLAASDASQREFLLSVSHDLRTPLTTISGYAESLADQVIPPQETAAVGETVLAEARRLTRMVNDLLDLGRAHSGQLRLDLTLVHGSALLSTTADVWRPQFEGAGVQWEAVLAPGVTLRVDPARLQQVLDGLLSNALRLVPAGERGVLALSQDAYGAIIEVRDSGPGLTHDDLPVAFDRGVLHDRYRGSREVGAGLGLAIVRQWVVAMGGQIEAGHAPEGGARFTIRFPAVS
ncbi:HAMP domain-containing sensor histidine kinase [Branchiibius sp. NY16-3462-2]|uniref:sensor histidine kinase n=1 Tax=Branchiibius sp. NY16-3462-2 TaxID=1807500 RepID=UPI0007915AD5|nr:HAMP domain-containing sensor histidine kinase [Branchiibius sp. NY16-3462-2]KYH44427.1 hypothetical protein AZH51_07845 [Branchiibius sp. NY16-3462-2]